MGLFTRSAWGLLKCYCAFHVISEYVAEPTFLEGPSMKPTINKNHKIEVAVFEKISVRKERLKVGDVVTAKHPYYNGMRICKRLMGMEGDRILKTDPNTNKMEMVIVPKGHVWLEGDNADQSKDSREYGPIPYALLRGRALCKIWPLAGNKSFQMPSITAKVE
ncbi:Mitochondrial inner membrane protease subunit 1 [Oopsacas minuta]|uniref:Mitochondrial inner membrane protease subunit 1 n=1 Tax=Oopsacas minuta TaxID=111878 RepID=A0AAV7KJZ3_9METZ|nr:Mitochondrial inner membrane protease subunit 1 [Oopsacas minuta]